MKSVLLSLLLLIGFITGSRAAIYVERQPLILGHEGQCYDKYENAFYKRGEEMTWREKECGRKLCGGTYVEIQTCGKVGIPPECRLESDPSLPYPKCCGWIICPAPTSFPPDSENELE